MSCDVLLMGRYVEAANLVTTSDIARRIGVAVETVASWAIRYSDEMPDPVARVGLDGRTSLYLWPEIKAWLIHVQALPPLHNGGVDDQPYERPVAATAAELMSAGEIRQLLNWKHSSTVTAAWKNGTFPDPFVDKPGARLWLRGEVLHWKQTAKRRPGGRHS